MIGKSIHLFTIIGIVSIVIQLIETKSAGAPFESCLTLTPKHGTNPPQPSHTSPFVVNATQTIDENEGERLKLLFGHHSIEPHFNTWTHRNAREKEYVSATWTPPEEFSEPIVFMATIVKNKAIYWDNQYSDPLQMGYYSTDDDGTEANQEENQHENQNEGNHNETERMNHEHDEEEEDGEADQEDEDAAPSMVNDTETPRNISANYTSSATAAISTFVCNPILVLTILMLIKI
ncbi:hypothetical protein RDWZM_001953 [Blomia tropicalis]|uniref:Reelin domain-containing protein n=1 Tax=Blomia tropicalis TaxID=40697 RepID=A0A9Q0ME21_BLOTA|nr:hypothetical protein RDWZM_001953 [Blomia tropicalis]